MKMMIIFNLKQRETKMSNPKFSNDDKNALMPLNPELNFLGKTFRLNR
jgi:hypothetical protein